MKVLKTNIVGFILTIFAAAIITGCTNEAPKKDYVARVNDKYLTAEDLNNLIDTSGTNTFYRNEVIRNWINQQLIYQEAEKDDITKDNEYKRLLDKAKKELAVTLFINKLLKEKDFDITDTQIESYYNDHKNEFKLFYDAYVINFIQFNNEDRAIKFRSILLESDWSKALNAFNNDSSIIKATSGTLDYDYELQPASLTRLVKELNPNEVSIVFGDSTGNYSLVQLVKKFNSGDIPPLEIIKDRVGKRLLVEMKDEFIKNYINELYSNNDIEVKN